MGITSGVSLSPLSAIADMVTPVVLITVAVIFSNALLTTAVAMTDRAFALEQERLNILGGPHGEILDEDSVPPKDRERLRQISAQLPRLIRHARRGRFAVLIVWIAIGLFVLSVAAVAVAATARSEAFAFTALALVLAGVAGLFAALATVTVAQARPANSLIETIRHTRVHG
jgi:hypothetical protein